MTMSTTARIDGQIRVDHVYDADGAYDGTATAMDIDMQGYGACLTLLFGTSVAFSAANLITGFKIVSNSDADGGGTDTDIAEAVTTDGGTTQTLTEANAGTAVNTAVNNQLMALDIRASQMPQGDRYVAAVIAATTTGALPIHIIYIRYNASHSFKDVIQATRTAFQYDGNL